MQLSDAKGRKPVAVAQAQTKAAAGSVRRNLLAVEEDVPAEGVTGASLPVGSDPSRIASRGDAAGAASCGAQGEPAGAQAGVSRPQETQASGANRAQKGAVGAQVGTAGALGALAADASVGATDRAVSRWVVPAAAPGSSSSATAVLGSSTAADLPPPRFR